jgi:hypothetical protein
MEHLTTKSQQLEKREDRTSFLFVHRRGNDIVLVSAYGNADRPRKCQTNFKDDIKGAYAIHRT